MVELKVISREEWERMKEGGPVEIRFGFGESPFGGWAVGVMGDRICHLSFVEGGGSGSAGVLGSQWPGARVVVEEGLGREVGRRVFEGGGTLGVLLKGSRFEAKVWESLLRIPRGSTASYEEVARMIGRPSAVRAAARAVAKNSVAYLVPCHRVVRKDGRVHKYRWGSHIKEAILDFEKRFV